MAAEKANLAKSDFLSSMSHELRTPLGAILGFAQLLESSTPPPRHMQQKSIAQILKAGWYLLELINEVLDLALIESGKLPMSIETISLDEVMQECILMSEPQAKTYGIKMILNRSDSMNFVNVDRTRLKQVILNLLSNAIKYNRDGCSVILESSQSTEDMIRISVRDTGEGLSEEQLGQLGQLFQPFNRLGQEANNQEGTGIGLVVSKRLVESMDGIIGVQSHVGVGSVFWFELKRTVDSLSNLDATTSMPLLPLQCEDPERLKSLLYVEDIIARRPNLRFLSATDAVSGIEMAHTYQPDVILMDINLQGISGLTALHILREDPTTAAIPVMAMSANAIPRDIEKVLDAGFFRYLTKPLRINEFLKTLDIALEYTNQSADIPNNEVT
ncbi:MAG: CheY-like chemotaxis protein/anti-sigma regulatory factor (Ser/Thr protein kinase) [Shewanella psychromarinicola]|jgi:CheY-like chemotaxis protein/anti-sigma regulatory factor (Ser/Thr protein kinase)|uniref:hybrid sensor histidine kinase/response regulator n=1 Tax=Shewanella psychromarinicola TaxID=2487742 RepID=UPI003EEAE947